MGKVVFNRSYSSFSLSKEACQRYWDIKGQQVWIEGDHYSFTVWLVPPEERLKKRYRYYMTMDEIVAYDKEYSEQTWRYDRSVSRHDPILVQAVEELGEKAKGFNLINGSYADLQIEEVEGLYRIDEYDGMERVMTPSDYEWENANENE